MVVEEDGIVLEEYRRALEVCTQLCRRLRCRLNLVHCSAPSTCSHTLKQSEKGLDGAVAELLARAGMSAKVPGAAGPSDIEKACARQALEDLCAGAGLDAASTPAGAGALVARIEALEAQAAGLSRRALSHTVFHPLTSVEHRVLSVISTRRGWAWATKGGSRTRPRGAEAAPPCSRCWG